MNVFRAANAAAAASTARPMNRFGYAFPTVHTTITTTRAASNLSAIVRGVRRTLRDPNQLPGYQAGVAAKVRERRLAREQAPKPTFKIKRGKKDVTQDPLPPPQSRKARFYDPENNFGKRSIVYKLKSGALDEEIRALSKGEDEDGDGYSKREGKSDGRVDSTDAFAKMMAAGEEQSGRDRRGSGGSGGRDRGQRGRSRDRRGGGGSFGGRDERKTSFGDRRRQFTEGSGGGRRRYERRDGDEGGDRPRERYGRNERDDRSRGSYGRQEGDRPRERYERNEREDRSRGSYGRQEGADRPRERYNEEDVFGGERQHFGKKKSNPAPTTIPFTTAGSQFLYGRSVVEAALRAGRRTLYRLYIHQDSAEARPDSELQRLAKTAAREGPVEVQIVGKDWGSMLDRMSKGRPHNNVVLEASAVPQPPVVSLGPYKDQEDIAGFGFSLDYQPKEQAEINAKMGTFVRMTGSKERKPLVLLAERVLDPGNLGAILRTAHFLGAQAVVTTQHATAPLTPVALKASAGAAEVLPLCTTGNIVDFLKQSRANGWKAYAAVAPTDSSKFTKEMDLTDLEQADPLQSDPCILVLGSEGEGLGHAVRREADVLLSIANRSGSQLVDSLNVSVAAGLLCSAFVRGGAVSTTASKDEAELESRTAEDDLGLWK